MSNPDYTPTPMTDAESYRAKDFDEMQFVVPSEFAERLEHALAEAQNKTRYIYTLRLQKERNDLRRRIRELEAELAARHCGNSQADALRHVTHLVRCVQHERVQSELSGFRNGFEHPITVSAFNVLVSAVDALFVQDAAKGSDHD